MAVPPVMGVEAAFLPAGIRRLSGRALWGEMFCMQATGVRCVCCARAYRQRAGRAGCAWWPDRKRPGSSMRGAGVFVETLGGVASCRRGRGWRAGGDAITRAELRRGRAAGACRCRRMASDRFGWDGPVTGGTR